MVDDICYISQSGPKKSKLVSRTIKLFGKEYHAFKTMMWIFIATISIAAGMGILALFGVWGDLEFKILLTTSMTGAAAIILLVLFWLLKNSVNVRTLLAGSTITALLLGTMETWFDISFMPELWLSAGALTYFGLTGIASYNIYKKVKYFSYAGMGSSALGYILTQIYIIRIYTGGDFMDFDWLAKLCLDTIILAFLLGHISLLYLINTSNPIVNGFRWTNIVIGAMVAATFIFVIHGEPEIFTTFTVALIILDVALTLITPILNKVMN